ncbi:hypothetical protein EDD86DRAFT_218145 [Gorgonomyces haynaldii]|nr:hypothetical protein EDD86DRAFT_218145 [Gorgonomyces haynaldii]
MEQGSIADCKFSVADMTTDDNLDKNLLDLLKQRKFTEFKQTMQLLTFYDKFSPPLFPMLSCIEQDLQHIYSMESLGQSDDQVSMYGHGVPQKQKILLSPTLVFWPGKDSKKAYITMEAGPQQHYLPPHLKQFIVTGQPIVPPADMQEYSIVQMTLYGGQSVHMYHPLASSTRFADANYILNLEEPIIVPHVIATQLRQLLHPKQHQRTHSSLEWLEEAAYEQHLVFSLT